MKDKSLILIVEDDLPLAKEMEEMLNATYSYRAIVAHNGIEAFKMLKKYQRFFGLLNNKIDCILLDFQMPEMSGEEFLRKLRKSERWSPFKRFIPVIVTTAYEDLSRWDIATDPIYGLAAGYLVKPIDRKKLFNLLHAIVVKQDTEYLIEDTLKEDYIEHDKHETKK